MPNAGIFEFLKVLIFANRGQSYVLGDLRHEEKRMLMHEASVRGKTERKIYCFWKTKLVVKYVCVCRLLEMSHLINISSKIGLYICILAIVGIGPYRDILLIHFFLHYFFKYSLLFMLLSDCDTTTTTASNSSPIKLPYSTGSLEIGKWYI